MTPIMRDGKSLAVVDIGVAQRLSSIWRRRLTASISVAWGTCGSGRPRGMRWSLSRAARVSSAWASRSASVVSASIGAIRSSMPRRWQALSKPGCAVSGFTTLGRSMPRRAR